MRRSGNEDIIFDCIVLTIATEPSRQNPQIL